MRLKVPMMERISGPLLTAVLAATMESLRLRILLLESLKMPPPLLVAELPESVHALRLSVVTVL
jgi:hypothetical protein